MVELGKTNVQLECSVYDSNPTTGLMYRWTKDGSQINTNQTFIMRTVRKSDQGSYQCIASNSVGTSVPATVTVEVLCRYLYIIQFSILSSYIYILLLNRCNHFI